MSQTNVSPLAADFKIRTITGFLHLKPSDFQTASLQAKIDDVTAVLRDAQDNLEAAGYRVQTVRLATNPFGEYLTAGDDAYVEEQLQQLSGCIQRAKVSFCSLGPAETEAELALVPTLVLKHRLSCSARLDACDVTRAHQIARVVYEIADADSEGNFNFCMAAHADAGIPFFPVAYAKSDEECSFAVGFENGPLFGRLLREMTLANVTTTLPALLIEAWSPVQDICVRVSQRHKGVRYAGMDTSLNPSLELEGSAAAALEALLPSGHELGDPGTVAASAAVTRCLQGLSGIDLTGYCGVMLPLCEDVRLAQLSKRGALSIPTLLSTSHVCGVGIDTVPIPRDTPVETMAALLLDVSAVAHRWGKSLSCRVLPMPGKVAGEKVSFDSPHMIDANILPLR